MQENSDAFCRRAIDSVSRKYSTCRVNVSKIRGLHFWRVGIFDGFGAGNRRLVKRAAKSQQVLGLYQKFARFKALRKQCTDCFLISTSFYNAKKIKAVKV